MTAAKSHLRNLVTAEEAFFADSSAYTSIIDNTTTSSTRLHRHDPAGDHRGRRLLVRDEFAYVAARW
ncbi:MAG TPA: hypothetical protein VII52_12730 [Gemmatimonadaceae bacterium]